jgi:hypothetical protein
MPPLFRNIANGIHRYGKPVNPFSIANIGIGTGWFGWSSILKFRFIALSAKRARQG